MGKDMFGQCPKCPKGSPDRRLFGGHCQYHLHHPEDDHTGQRVKKESPGISEAAQRKAWFDEQEKLIPGKCENCKGRIVTTAAWPKKSAVCHIVPKKHFKSVQFHPLNRWFGCIDCHTNYDQKGSDHAVKMNIWPTVVARFKKFMDLIDEKELKHLPKALRDITGR